MNQSDYEVIELCLFGPCSEKLTGTSIITSNRRRSCQITITDGVILAASMGRAKGSDAISELRKEGVKAGAFKEGLKLPFKDENIIPSSGETLLFLGAGRPPSVAKAEDTSSSNEKEEPVKKSVRMYRGNIIED